ncbi:MAG: DMT family transporter [Myxococcota bacterium]
MLGVLLAVGCGLAYGGLDAVRKALLESYRPIALLIQLTLAQSIAYATWVGGVGFRVTGDYLPYGAAVAVLQIAANLLLLEALKISELGRTIPFLSLTPIFTAGIGAVALGEAPGELQWLGTSFVTLGAALLALVPSRSGGLRIDFGSGLAISVAGLWSLTAALDRWAVDESNPASHAFLQAAGIALVLGSWALCARIPMWPHKQRGAMLLAVVFGSVALACQLTAIQFTWVSLVETIKRAAGALLALVVGRLRFQEPVDRRKLLGVLAVVVGTSLVLLGHSG